MVGRKTIVGTRHSADQNVLDVARFFGVNHSGGVLSRSATFVLAAQSFLGSLETVVAACNKFSSVSLTLELAGGGDSRKIKMVFQTINFTKERKFCSVYAWHCLCCPEQGFSQQSSQISHFPKKYAKKLSFVRLSRLSDIMFDARQATFANVQGVELFCLCTSSEDKLFGL